MSLKELAERVLSMSDLGAGQRVVLAIAGSPGSGKSTLAEHLVGMLNSSGSDIAVYLPMDGFHLSNSTLERGGLKGRKGSIETFDGWGFFALLQRIRQERGHTIYAPSFHRTVDEGVAGDIAVEDHHSVVVIEGNYLLVQEEPWRSIGSLVTEAWFCETPEDERLERLIKRHTLYGRPAEEAELWATQVDGKNAELIEKTKPYSDLVVSGVDAAVIRS